MNRWSVGIPVVAFLAFAFIGWGCGGGGGAVSTPPPADPGASPAPRGEPLGEPPVPVAEPDQAPDRSSPEAVLRSILAGRARQDLPYLARCEAVTAEKAQLDSLDAARAWRFYCMNARKPYWDRIEGALESGQVTFTEDGDGATATFEVGGALGTLDLRFAKIGGNWHIDYGQE